MGNDGGVIAVARKYMRHGHQKQRDEKGDQDALREKRTTMCALTDEPLQEPIVACKLGNLFNKDRLIEKLLDRSLPEKFDYIRSMKDVVTCKFYPAPEAKSATENSNMKRATNRFRFHCPITLQLFNGAHRFVLLKKCGCVLSEKALKEVKPKDCLMCGFPIKSSKELWPLLLSDEDAAVVLASIRKSEKPLKRKRDLDTAPLALDESAAKKAKSKVQTVNQAEEAVSQEKGRNPVYASLFSTEQDTKKTANELLMTIAGLRYTLS
ncbi:hypothetical protein DYB37_000930 [Aphanomyces astaci]|uniref:Uncharacterized protein n=4 Tax=Aphanomyces astaci TaxID=112090 RepID=A0A397ACF0_APHAT|nr:hypothetical protein AaE_003799 [Aphanomyces astaci]RHY05262.1 hypothetical protein DYB36_006635 [Aphanomyces astaci]RHY53883.1 hypothetical protein DYB38_002430 [Aphanomyces astaci]RHY71287.1 hypothetical protein DYB34_006429 [Aphanomyces astaci]RHY71641.1 hypothetical protein DYB30_000164 [Aphanomyces astaci]